MSRSVSELKRAFREVRDYSLELARPLSPEDQQVQSMTDASPTKWHLAHTTWFFETALLNPHARGYALFHEKYPFLFNSYYEALGPRHERARRGLLTRPTLDEVHAYRRHIDDAVLALIESADAQALAQIAPILTLGLHHEQQHQELILTDILHAFSCNTLMPAYRDSRHDGCDRRPESTPGAPLALQPVEWLRRPGGVVGIGHAEEGFCFDNELPRHEVLLRPYEIAHRLVTCGDYAAFVADGGYERPELWLSDGWAIVQREQLAAPVYWHKAEDRWSANDPSSWLIFGLDGLQPLDPRAPVSQLSFFEAAAYAEWAGARLPTEFEWEAAFDAPGITQMTGHVWQWTRSSYDPYPGFRPLPGIVVEYNGKFMVGQIVLRGGSIATPPGHARRSYRNFFPPAARWQFSGVRLVRDL
ncbi:ergothioneine biosynthesis protein EgtB [Trinickia mobilis]|uniref:ergothioneine biosynthesis protein EgtB n=1 Tax=Trinickia mobilis TaxID=2816356 RepID=UPI001A905F49|nr:ergothioneine biosynthesis protein EgtB [Trinickia mobilis]